MNHDAVNASPLIDESTEGADHPAKGVWVPAVATHPVGAKASPAQCNDPDQHDAIRVLAARINGAIDTACLPDGKQMRVLVDSRTSQLVVLLTLDEVEYIVRRIDPVEALQTQHALAGLKGLMLNGEG